MRYSVQIVKVVVEAGAQGLGKQVYTGWQTIIHQPQQHWHFDSTTKKNIR